MVVYLVRDISREDNDHSKLVAKQGHSHEG